MRIFVVSDTHGNLKNAIALYDRVTANNPVDCIIHCGDFYSDGVRLAEIYGQPVYAVHGNCDGGRDEEFKVVETPAGKILVIHGHVEDVKFSLDNAAYLARRENCTAVCYGHTHKPVIKEHNGILFVNPGTASLPKYGAKCSASVVTATEEGLTASTVYL